MRRYVVFISGVALVAAVHAASCIVSGSTERTADYSSSSAVVEGNEILASNGGIWYATSLKALNFLVPGFWLSIR